MKMQFVPIFFHRVSCWCRKALLLLFYHTNPDKTGTDEELNKAPVRFAAQGLQSGLTDISISGNQKTLKAVTTPSAAPGNGPSQNLGKDDTLHQVVRRHGGMLGRQRLRCRLIRYR